MRKIIRTIFLVSLVPYVGWVASRDHLNPRWVFAVILGISILAPVIVARLVPGRTKSAIAALFGTPVLIGIFTYLVALTEGDRESLAWLPIIIASEVGGTAPIWLLESVVLCAMKAEAGSRVSQVSLGQASEAKGKTGTDTPP